MDTSSKAAGALSIMSTWAAILKVNNQEIGIAMNCNWDEDFGMVPIEVFNHYGPIDHKPTRYSIRITTGIYILDTGNGSDAPVLGSVMKKNDIITVAPVQMEILNKLTLATKDVFDNCRTATRSASYAQNALVSASSTWLGTSHNEG